MALEVELVEKACASNDGCFSVVYHECLSFHSRSRNDMHPDRLKQWSQLLGEKLNLKVLGWLIGNSDA